MDLVGQNGEPRPGTGVDWSAGCSQFYRFNSRGYVQMASDRLSAQEVHSFFNRPRNHLVFVDARSPQAWAESDQMLPNAVRVPVDEVQSHRNEIDFKATVIA